MLLYGVAFLMFRREEDGETKVFVLENHEVQLKELHDE